MTDKEIKQGDLATGGMRIQPDGFLYLKLVGMVRAEGLTIPQLRKNLEIAYKDKIKTPAIDVTPVRTNLALADLLATVDTRGNIAGGQSFQDTVHIDGTIRMPKIGSICVLGMTLDELKREVNLRYAEQIWVWKSNRTWKPKLRTSSSCMAKSTNLTVINCWDRQPLARHWRWPVASRLVAINDRS